MNMLQGSVDIFFPTDFHMLMDLDREAERDVRESRLQKSEAVLDVQRSRQVVSVMVLTPFHPSFH